METFLWNVSNTHPSTSEKDLERNVFIVIDATQYLCPAMKGMVEVRVLVKLYKDYLDNVHFSRLRMFGTTKKHIYKVRFYECSGPLIIWRPILWSGHHEPEPTTYVCNSFFDLKGLIAHGLGEIVKTDVLSVPMGCLEGRYTPVYWKGDPFVPPTDCCFMDIPQYDPRYAAGQKPPSTFTFRSRKLAEDMVSARSGDITHSRYAKNIFPRTGPYVFGTSSGFLRPEV